MDYSITRDIIGKSQFLPAADSDFIAGNIAEIQANWEKRQVFRTETEMRISVLNDIKFPTPAAKYWQCVREQAVFYENLVTLSFEFRRNGIKQKKLSAEISEATGLDKELLEIDLEEARFAQLNMEQTARDRAREIRLWSQLMAECVKDDPAFDTNNVDTHQLLSYGLRFEAQLQNIGTASPSEMANLVGQYDTTVRHLEAAGIERPQGKAVPNIKATNIKATKIKATKIKAV